MKKFKLIISIVLALLIFINSMFAMAIETVEKEMIQFKDIETHWANETITSLSLKGIINGYLDMTYRPEAVVTVAEFIKLSLGTAGIRIENHSEVWHKNIMDKALELGIIDSFLYNNPDAAINRKDVAVVLAKLVEVVPTLKDEFVPIEIKELDEDVVFQLRPDLNFRAEYWNPTSRQLRKVIVTYGNGNTKEILNWNKGGIEERLQSRAEKLYGIYYKKFPLDHSRFQYIINDLNGLSAAEKESIYKLFDYGLIIGNIDEYYNVAYMPQSNLTRAEIATIVERLIAPEKRQVIDEIYDPKLKELDTTHLVTYQEHFNNNGVFRSNQYKAILRNKEVLKNINANTQRYTNNTNERLYFELIYEYPSLPIDNYSMVTTIEANSNSLWSSYFIPSTHRETFNKDLNFYINEVNKNKNFYVNKTYGQARVNFTSAPFGQKQVRLTIYPSVDEFKYYIDRYKLSINLSIESQDGGYSLELANKMEEGYEKELIKAVLNNPDISVEDLYKIVDKKWNTSIYW